MDFRPLKLKKLNKYFRVFFIFSLLSFCLQFIYPEDETTVLTKNSPNLENTGDNNFGIYYFKQSEKGQPIFTQIIKWTGSDGVLKYEVTLKTENDVLIFEKRATNQTELHLNLKPGKYHYKVYAYNMLGVIEQESDWIEFEIKEAFLPNINRIKPERLYLEDEDCHLTVEGSGFTDEAQIYFVSDDETITRQIKPESITDEKIVFNFKNPAVFLGKPYFLTIIDPSGLSTTSKEFIVKYRKPIDFYVGIGYTPFIPVYDSWYVEKWNKKFYPIGFTTELGAIFLKTAGGFIGTELRGTFRRSDLKAKSITIKNSSILASASLLYEYWFLQKLSFSIKAGGGLAINKFVTEDKRKERSIDPMYTIGIGLRAKPLKYFYIDIGLYVDQIINTGTKPLYISPEIALGFRY